MWVRSIVKGSIPRTGDERFDSAAGRSTGIVVWLSSDCRNWRCNTRRVAFLASVSSRTSIRKQFRPYDTPQVIAGQARGKLLSTCHVPSRTICRWGKMIGWLGLTEGELRGQSRGVRSGSAGSPDCEETMNIGFVWAGPTGQKPHLRSCENASYVETKLASFGHFSMGTARPREGPRTVRTSRCKVGQAEGADPPE